MAKAGIPLIEAIWAAALCAQPYPGPAMEPANFRAAQYLLDTGNVTEGLVLAERGLEAAPRSARLYMVKAEAQERLGHYFEARQTLRAASAVVQDEALLARLAEMEDASGQAAAQTYLRLVAARGPAAAGSPETIALLKRGLETALRDGDGKSAAELRLRLADATGRGSADRSVIEEEARRTGVVVPGGLEGLEFVARFKSRSPEGFFADYCRALVDRTESSKEEGSRYLDSIRRYFQLVSNLKALGTKEGDKIEIVLSAAGKKDRQHTEKVLNLLGWKMRTRKDEVTLEAGENDAQAKRQELGPALTVDEVGLEDALRSGRTFRIEMADGSAPVTMGELRWMAAFFPWENFSGGFAEALTHDLRAARIYAALSVMSVRAAAALGAGSDLKLLAEKHADLMYRYSSAFVLDGDRAAVPGGLAGEPVWQELAGAPPADPSRFFHALLEKDYGKLLAFFSMLGQLDASRQRFFTHTAARTARFYEVFRASREMTQGAAKGTRFTSFFDFLREIPLSPDGRVLFPGGPVVWMAANSPPVSRTAKMARRFPAEAGLEQEDEILLRLAGTRYRLANDMLAQSDSFVAVARIDRHRDKPLDSASALLLAGHYGDAHPVYPYFSSLTALEARHFDGFFGLLERLRELPPLQLNGVLGEIHSLVAVLCLAQESGAMKPDQAAEVFGSLVERFAEAAGEAGYTRAALETIRELLNKARPGEASRDPDGALERTLLEEPAPVTFELEGVRHQLNPAEARRAAYRKVLQYQRVPSLGTLLSFFDAVNELAEGRSSTAGALSALDTLRGGFPAPDVPGALMADEIDRKLLSEFVPAKTAGLIARLKRQTSGGNPDRGEVRQLCQELLASVAPQVKTALAGVVYAYYLRPGDLLVSQDPLLLRKHRFVNLRASTRLLFCRAELISRSEGAGSYLLGGFADFAAVAGKVAWSGAKSDSASDYMAEAQIGSLRAGGWSRLTERDLTLLELRLRLAREWVMRAAADKRLFSSLAQDVVGVLSPARGSRLLDAAAAENWDEAFQALTLGDLYFLSVRYLERYPRDLWQSPVTVALRKAQPAWGDSDLLSSGGGAVGLHGCIHPHLAEAGPYEGYEKLLLPYKLAERTAEFKLYLADMAARTGLPPAALSSVAEPAAMRILSKLRMNDALDWRAVTAAFANLDESAIAGSFTKDQ